jgi:hypothetical protein
MAQPGDHAVALALVDQAIVQVERPGWEERWHHAAGEILGARARKPRAFWAA